MAVRSVCETGNVTLPPNKLPRLAASDYSKLQGFEFLEAVAKLDSDQIQALDHSRITYLFRELRICIHNKTTRIRSINVACRVVEFTAKTHLVQKESLCKVLLSYRADKLIERMLVEFSNHLFLTGNFLFKDFTFLAAPTLGKLYEAIISKNDSLAMIYLQEPLDYKSPQHKDYNLFHLACRYLGYEVINLFLWKDPYITHLVFRNILLNPRLSPQAKLGLIAGLYNMGISVNEMDEVDMLPIHYAIKLKEECAFKYLWLRTNVDNDQIFQNIIKADFEAGLCVLQLNKDHIIYAISVGNFYLAVKIAKLINVKWDVDPVVRLTLAPLKALSKEDAVLVKRIDHVAAFRQIEKNPSIFSMENFRILRRESVYHYITLAKRVAHAWSLDVELKDPKTGEPFECAGGASLKTLLYWIDFLNTVDDIPQAEDLLKEFKRTFHEHSYDDELDEIQLRLNNKKVVICSAGYYTHSTYALFFSDVALYSNRGRDAITRGTSIYSIKNPGIVSLHARKIVKTQLFGRQDYYSERKMVAGAELKFVQSIKQKEQSGNFCTLSSLKAASFALLNLKIIPPSKLKDENAWIEAANANRPVYKELTSRYRFSVLKGLIFEIEDFLQSGQAMAKIAGFYYVLLLLLKSKLDNSNRFKAYQPEKTYYSNLIKLYLNLLIDKI